MRLRRTLPAALLLLTPALAACGGGDDSPGAADATSSPSTPTDAASTATDPASVPTTPSASTATQAPSSVSAAPTSSAPAPVALPKACDLVTSAEIGSTYEMRFGAARPGGGGTSQGSLAWKSNDCSFQAAGQAEVTVKLTGPGDFTQGKFGCPRPSEISAVVDPADVAGAMRAWWKVSDQPPLRSTLRACADAVLLEIDLDYEPGVSYDGDPPAQSGALAEKILAQLKG